MHFALAHLDWTVEDWKTVVWSDETKINRLGSDGRKWAWKRAGEGLSDRLVEETVKFGGGSMCQESLVRVHYIFFPEFLLFR